MVFFIYFCQEHNGTDVGCVWKWRICHKVNMILIYFDMANPVRIKRPVRVFSLRFPDLRCWTLDSLHPSGTIVVDNVWFSARHPQNGMVPWFFRRSPTSPMVDFSAWILHDFYGWGIWKISNSLGSDKWHVLRVGPLQVTVECCSVGSNIYSRWETWTRPWEDETAMAGHGSISTRNVHDIIKKAGSSTFKSGDQSSRMGGGWVYIRVNTRMAILTLKIRKPGRPDTYPHPLHKFKQQEVIQKILTLAPCDTLERHATPSDIRNSNNMNPPGKTWIQQEDQYHSRFSCTCSWQMADGLLA